MPRKIAILTGTRADFGLLRPLCLAINADPETELALIVTGMHLAPEFGLTVSEIENEGFAIAERVDMLLASDGAQAITKSMGLGMIGYADALARVAPDVLVVLGDRFETFAAAAAAMAASIPIAHIHGGEITEGALDDQMRHAITKMANVHFPTTEIYRRRIVQMGEPPETVFSVGAPALDTIRGFEAMDRGALSADLGLDLDGDGPLFLVTFHPVTTEPGASVVQCRSVLDALDRFRDARIVMTYPNADAEGRALIGTITDWAQAKSETVALVQSLGQKRYLSVMSMADVVIGNSSSGIIEAPQFAVPTVNIGSRQNGRIMAPSVVSCPPMADDIAQAIDTALSPALQATLKDMENPYGDGTSAAQTLAVLKTADLKVGRVRKVFCDIETR